MIAFLLLLHFASAQTLLEGVQSGRYEIHSKDRAVLKKTNVVQAKSHLKKLRKPNAEESVAKESTVDSLPKDSDDTKGPGAKTQTSAPESGIKVQEETTSSTKDPQEIVEPSLGDQAEKLVSGQVDQVFNFYQERVHPDDVRNNRIEIEFSPGFIHNESKSNYSFRDYGSSFSSLTLGSKVWFTPRIGIEGKFSFSLAADLSADKATQSKVPARYEFLDLSINLRNYFGLSRKAKSWEFNLLYVDDKLNVPSDNLSRMRIRSSGFGLGLKTRLPSSAHYAWVFGVSFLPRLQHSEEPTSAGAQSGAGPESTRVGFDLGGEFKLNRENQIIWSAGIRSEKNLFSDSAGLPDPTTGQTPTNVGVTNTYYLFNLGYRWGQ